MPNQPRQTAVIIGAGPAGLTAAMELLQHTNIQPIILEASNSIGGISKTVKFNGHRMDIGGHRFFSKSDEIIDWWLRILPLEKQIEGQEIRYQNKNHILTYANQDAFVETDDIMMIRKRKSRILYSKKFFEYPITLSLGTLRNLGLMKIAKIGFSYIKVRLAPIKDEKNLEDFFINRFGTELYLTFFKSYTEKVWGKKCTEIGADWGKQRIKELSVSKTIINAIKKPFRKRSIDQKNTETSLIEYFLYPKFGPGHMWETVADKAVAQGAELRMNALAHKIMHENNSVQHVTYIDTRTGKEVEIKADYVFSTMPIDKVFKSFNEQSVPKPISDIATSLEYRNFITIGMLIPAEYISDITDNWIYIHEPDVHVGRIQFFHNWSEHMVRKQKYALIGMEYFCDEGDHLWNMPKDEFRRMAGRELVSIGLIPSTDIILDSHIEKVEKAYPSYTGIYDRFDQVKNYLDGISNFYPIGRNGMHRYNNQDHSMLTAMAAVKSVMGLYNKSDVWNINADEAYHEKK